MVHHLKRIALIVLLLLGKPAYAEDTTSSRITIQLETIMKEFWNEARKRKLEHRLDEFANTPKGEQLLARYFGSLQKFLGSTATESDFEDFLDRTKILMGMLRNRRKIVYVCEDSS